MRLGFGHPTAPNITNPTPLNKRSSTGLSLNTKNLPPTTTSEGDSRETVAGLELRKLLGSPLSGEPEQQKLKEIEELNNARKSG